MIHHSLADRQTQARSTCTPCSRGVSPVEAVEEMRQHLDCNGIACISYHDGYVTSIHRHFDRNHLTVWAMLNCILQKLGADRLPPLPGHRCPQTFIAGRFEPHPA